MLTVLQKKVCGIAIGIFGGVTGVLIALDLLPSFVTSPIFYGPLLGFLGGVLGTSIAVKNESEPQKKRQLVIMGVSILAVCLLFWIGVVIFITIK